MQAVLSELPPSAFPHPTGEYSRRYWEEVWFVPAAK